MGQMQKARGVATSVKTVDGVTRVRYHNTDVVVFTDKYIELDTGGWETATTKARMNQASNEFGLGYNVFQKDWAWYLSHDGDVTDFHGSALILREGVGA